MSMVDWLLTEQLVEIFRDARLKRPDLNAELEARSAHGEPDVLAGAGTAVRIRTTDGGILVVTPRRIVGVAGQAAADLIAFTDLVGYDWISPQMSEKVALKGRHYDRLYLYPREAPPILLDHLGDAVYPLMSFLGRVLEYQSQKVFLRKLDDEVVERLGRCLAAAAEGPFFTDAELGELFRRSRESMQLIAGMWPRMNLAAPDVLDLIDRLVAALIPRATVDEAAWSHWIGASPGQIEAAREAFRRVSEGEV